MPMITRFGQKLNEEIEKAQKINSFLNAIKQDLFSANADSAWRSVANILIYLAFLSLQAVSEVKDQNKMKENSNPEVIKAFSSP